MVGPLLGLNPRYAQTLDYGTCNFSLHLAVQAILTGDKQVMLAVTLLVGTVYVLLNVAADIATILLTPRLRTAMR